MKYLKLSFTLSLCGVLLFSACNSHKKGPAEIEAEKIADQQAIRKIMDTYNTHFAKAEFAPMTDYIYPGIFNYFSKEEMIISMENSMHSDDFDISIRNITIDSISPIYISEGDGKYAWIAHRAKALYQFKPSATDETLRASCINYTASFGDENVECNIAEKNFLITIPDLSFFIYKDSLQKWYTLGTSSPEDLDRFIPADIRKQMGVNVSAER
jgi:hypothetical protein